MNLKELAAAASQRDLTATELGELADIYHEVRADRLIADKVAAGFKAEETLSEGLLIQQMQKQSITAAGGKSLRVGLSKPDYVPHVVDWDKYYSYIHENKAWEMLERRPGKAACRERWEAGIQVPGVEKFPVYKLTRNEVK